MISLEEFFMKLAFLLGMALAALIGYIIVEVVRIKLDNYNQKKYAKG